MAVGAMVLLAGQVAEAKSTGVLYDCDITEKRDRLYWIADKIAIVVKPDGQVVVFDEVIMRFNSQPMPARVTSETDRKLAIRWTLEDLTNSSNQHTSAFEYHATLNKSSNKISVFARPDGYPNRFTGSGHCTPRTE
jgi:hypothetical protein